MWIISCIQLMLGAVSAVFGVSFYIRNKDSGSNMRFYLCSYGISAAIWCICFGFIGFIEDDFVCDMIRKVGDAAIDVFILTEAFLVFEVSGIGKKINHLLRHLYIVAGLVDFFFFSQRGVNLYIHENGRTTWISNPDMAFNRMVHLGFMAFTFSTLFVVGLIWVKNNKQRRLRRFLAVVFISNFLLIFFTLPDTILPAFGIKAVSTAGIGAALCNAVIWYGATRLGSFDIRIGNIRDRLFEFIEAGIIVFDMDHKVALTNLYSRNLLKEGGTGTGLLDFFDIDEDTAAQMFEHSENDIYSERLKDKNREKIYAVRMSAVNDDYGETFCFMCVFVDVTEEVDAVARYQVASRAKSSFLAQMSHEIRTPINAVLGMNEMILRESKDNNILEYAENIDSAGNTLLVLINSILDFSKIEDGKMDIVPVRYDTASLINDLYNSIIQRADAKGLSLVLDVADDLPCAMVGDNVRVSQIIMNLLTNAVKYTEKGTVTLTMRKDKQTECSVRLFISVKDTGIGIKEEDKSRLFETFERLDEVRNHNIEGTGLGISIVTNLLDMMGSSLKFDSTYGEGSEFYFILEQEIADAAPIGNLQERMKDSSARKDKDSVISAPAARILLVDDNDMNLKVAKNLLKLCNIKPDMVNSGFDAIEYMKKNKYDIVFLDHMMPKMDGIETLSRLKEESLVPENTVMIALTANAVVGAKETYLDAGFDDYLSKPIKIKVLVQKLEKYLPQSAYDVAQPVEKTSGVENNADSRDKNEKSNDDLIIEFNPADTENVLESNPSDDAVMEFSADSSYAQSSGYSTDALDSGGIDVKVGLSYCGDDEDLYFEMLDDYESSAEEKLSSLDALYHDKNWHEYEVLVHALKSNSKMIGAGETFELTRSLEEAAGSTDSAYIDQNHGKLLSLVRGVAKTIRDSRK